MTSVFSARSIGFVLSSLAQINFDRPSEVFSFAYKITEYSIDHKVKFEPICYIHCSCAQKVVERVSNLLVHSFLLRFSMALLSLLWLAIPNSESTARTQLLFTVRLTNDQQTTHFFVKRVC